MDIRISKFNKETREQFLSSDKTLLGNNVTVKEMTCETVVLLFDYETKEYFGLVKVGVFDDRTTCRQNYIPNIDGTYSGDYARYSKFEIPIGKFYSWKMTAERLVNVLGINSRLSNNIVKNMSAKSFSQPFYGSKNDSEIERKRVLDGFRFIVETVMARSD